MPAAMPVSSGATSRLKMTASLAQLPQQELTLHKQDLRSEKETWRGLGVWQGEKEREEGGPLLHCRHKGRGGIRSHITGQLHS
jgi:hypothetical protein